MTARAKTADHKSKPAQPQEWTNPGLARVSTEVDKATGVAICGCSCGWMSSVAKRRKVAEDAAERHVTKRHRGQALWL